MSDTLLVGTRKGLFHIEREKSGRWKITASCFLGDPVSMLLAETDRRCWHVALNLGHFGVKMQRSIDAGKTWSEVATPAYPTKPEGLVDKDPMRDKDIPWDTQQIWSLEQGGTNELWCGTIPGGLFHSQDNGDTWALVRSLWDDTRRQQWMGGGYDFAGIHSIAVDPRNASHVTIAVSSGGIWTTQDRGATWQLIGNGMRNAYMPPEKSGDPLTQDPHRVVQCLAQPERMWMQHHNGIFRSDDGGKNWTEIPDVPMSDFGFAVAVHPEQPDTAWFVPAIKDQQRIAVDGRVVVTRTRDGGKTFEVLDKGLPGEHAYDLVYRHCLDVSRDGKRLAFGSTTGSLWVSEDEGDSWQEISAHLPPVMCVRFAE
jgi:photosystem II stability/assembly factor-like uncharacterized protein